MESNILGLSYTVDASGLRTQIAETRPGPTNTTLTRTTDYTYDAVKRLTREQVSGTGQNRNSAWTYDKVGNRLNEATSGTLSKNATYTYDANDRLTRESGNTGLFDQAYDANGNLLTRKQGTTTLASYTWDVENRMTAATVGIGAAAKTMTYAYDPSGIRRSQEVLEGANRTRTEYLVDANQAYAQVLEDWKATAPTAGAMPDEALATSYVYGDDLISETLAAANASFVYHYDGLGTTRLLTKIASDATNAQVTDRYAYTAFGESDPAGSSGNTAGSTANLYRYTGEQLDPNLGFYYLRARYMDPGAGRFVGMDSWDGNNVDPLSLHKYTYAHNMPSIGTDPGGHEFTMQGLMSGISAGMSISLRAVSVYTNFIEPFAFDEDSERMTIFDMLMALVLKSAATSVTNLALMPTAMPIPAVANGHHVIPIYMCGKNTRFQECDIPTAAHKKMHKELDMLYHSVNILGLAVKFSLRRNQAARQYNKLPMQMAARTPVGRTGILGLLTAFYANGNYHGQTYDTLGSNKTISNVLLLYGSAKFVPLRKETSWLACKR